MSQHNIINYASGWTLRWI